MYFKSDKQIKKALERKEKKEKIIFLITFFIIIPFIIINVISIMKAVISKSKSPNIFGYQAFVVVTGSMTPNINIGDIVIAKMISIDDVKENDVIVFNDPVSSKPITHRVIQIDANPGYAKMLKTKGDSNNIEDSSVVIDEDLKGKVVFKIPYLGKIAIFFQDELNIMVFLLILYLYIIFYEWQKRKISIRQSKRINYENNMMNK